MIVLLVILIVVVVCGPIGVLVALMTAFIEES
jgi:hypothetical protein